MLLHATSEKKPGPVMAFDCPCCLAENVAGQSYATIDRLLLVFVLPLHTSVTVYLSCPKCRRTFKPLLPLDDLCCHPVDVRGQYLREHISWTQVLVALVALFLSWVPVVGLVVSLIALVVNWKASYWLTGISSAAMVVSVVATGIFVVLSA